MIDAAEQIHHGRFALISKITNDAVWDWDLAANTLWWDEGIEHLFGFDLEEVPPSIDWWSDHIHPDDRARVLESLHAAIDSGRSEWTAEYRYQRKDESYATVVDKGVVTRDDLGKPVRMLGGMRDVSEQREAQAALREAMEQAERSRARQEAIVRHLEEIVRERTERLQEMINELESFSYCLSHDMRAPLRAMKGFSDILHDKYRGTLGSEGCSYLHRIAAAASRLDQLIQDVLTYSRIVRERIELAPVDLERLTRQVIDENPALQPPHAKIELRAPLRPAMGHEAYLTQVLSNLLENAVKFVPPERRPRVRIWTEPNGEGTCLLIADNGIGIPKAAQPRLFRMFERLHSDRGFPGTGIGLAVARKAVERMGGRIEFTSNEGRGTTFRVYFPRAGPP